MRRRFALGAVVILVAAAGAALVATSDDGDGGGRVPVAQDPGGCRPPGDAPAPVPDAALARPAGVEVSGARSVDTGGLAPGDVIGTDDGTAWVVVRDSQTVAAPVGRVARVGPEADTIGAFVDVVEGCEIGALAAAPGGVLAATCDPLADAATGAELVELDAGSGSIRRRIPIPDSCVDGVVAGAAQAWITTAARFRTAAQVLRVDLATGAVDRPIALAPDETLLGLATADDGVWTSRRGPSGARLVRSDPADGAVLADVPSEPTVVVGVADGMLWTRDLDGDALVGRDAITGTPTVTVDVSGLRLAAAGPAGVWYEAATTDSLTVTVGLADAGGARTVTTYTGPGPDRTGLPFLGTLSATGRGAWLSIQDRLFLVTG